MKIRITIEINTDLEPQGVKESIATELERFGDCRIVNIRAIKPEPEVAEQIEFVSLDDYKAQYLKNLRKD